MVAGFGACRMAACKFGGKEKGHWRRLMNWFCMRLLFLLNPSILEKRPFSRFFLYPLPFFLAGQNLRSRIDPPLSDSSALIRCLFLWLEIEKWMFNPVNFFCSLLSCLLLRPPVFFVGLCLFAFPKRVELHIKGREQAKSKLILTAFAGGWLCLIVDRTPNPSSSLLYQSNRSQPSPHDLPFPPQKVLPKPPSMGR